MNSNPGTVPGTGGAGGTGIPRGLVPFTAAYLAAAVIGAVVSGNGEFVFYIVVMLVLIAVIALVHRRVRLSAGLLWALTVWGLLHMAGGLVPVPADWPYNPPNAVLYSLWLIPNLLKYDQVVHAYGFGVTTWLCWQALRVAVRAAGGGMLPARAGVLTLCAAGGMGFGALNEVICQPVGNEGRPDSFNSKTDVSRFDRNDTEVCAPIAGFFRKSSDFFRTKR